MQMYCKQTSPQIFRNMFRKLAVLKRVLLEESLRYSGVLTLERLGDQFDPLCEFFQKRVLWREGEALLFLTFNKPHLS